MLQFRRITAQNRFIPQIDGLRFVAIAWVQTSSTSMLLFRRAVPFPFPGL